MKKIFYILAAAIVALGTVACENEGLDNINPNINVDGDTVSFVAGINRTGLSVDNETVWDADDTIVVTWNGNDYEFKNAETGDKNTFKCTAEGLSAIVNAENIKAVYSNNKDGNVDSAEGVAGALLEYEGAFGDIAFEVKNAFLKFKANAGSEVKFTASKEIFSTGTELTLTATGEDQYVAVIPQTTTITYALDGVVCTTSEENTLKACKIYPLSNLEKVVVIKTKEDFLTFAEAVNNGTSYEGYTVKLNNDIDLEDAANTLSIVVKNNNITLDLNGKTLTVNNTRTATHNFFFDVNAGGVLTVENGSIVYTHTGTNMGWEGAATAFDVTGGGVLNMNGVNVTVSGTDMNFCVHLNNWGEVTFNADGCEFNATYCGVRVFNSGPHMNNVTIKDSKMTGATRAFWVHNYGSDDMGGKLYSGSSDAYDFKKVNARLNFDIFGNNNTYALSGEATSPVRYGMNSAIYFNPENGNQVLGNATDLSRFAKYVNEGIENYKGKTVELVKDIELTEAWTPVGQTGATQFHGTFDGQGHTIKGLTINAPESYSTNYATGMFGWVETGAVIKNIVLDEANINGYHYVGAIAGYMSGSAKIEGCKVINSEIVADPTKKDTAGEFNGDKVGGIVGYTNGSNVISGNEVSKTTIKGYRHMGGIVGYLLGTAENNTVDDTVVITVNNDNNYKNYAIQSNYGVNNIAGVVTGSATNNNGEVTIVWGDIPATLVNYVAQVGEDKYETIKDAIAAANAASASEIVIIDNVDLAEDSLSGFAGTIKGGEDVVLDFSNFSAASTYAFPISGTTTFENITFKFPAGSSSYLSAGLVGEGEFTFENCAFEGCFTINGGAEWAFNTCEFTNNDYYASFVYAAKEVVFTECSFSGKDRAAKIYGDGGDLYVEYHNCEFTSTTTKKAAIAIDATNANTIVIVDGCSQTNMNGLYSLDGTKGVVNPVAKDNNGKLYSSFEAALEASSTIELLANVEGTITISKACTINNPNGYNFNCTVANTLTHIVSGTTHSFNALTTTTTKWGIYGAHQDWKMATAEKLCQVEGLDNVYAVLNVTLKSDGFKFLDTTTAKEVTPNTADYDFFFKPNGNWKQASARFVGRFWNNDGDKFVEFSDSDNDGIYEGKLDGFKPTHVIFLRKNPTGYVYNNWTCWNRIGNITIASGKNCYTMANGVWTEEKESGSGYTGGSWSTIDNTPYWTGTDFGAYKKSSGKQYYNFSTEMGVGAWYTCYSNNLGEQSNNIGVNDFTKTYDVYLKITKETWGDLLDYTIVEHGTAVTLSLPLP